MNGVVATLAHWFGPWQSLYSDSKPVDIMVTAVHIVALLFGGGLAISADREMLRALRRGGAVTEDSLARLRTTHRPVIAALAVLFVSGIALASADIKTFSHSPTFLVKISLVTLLCANGLFLVLTERRLGRYQHQGAAAVPAGLWRRLRTATWLSLILWTSTAIAGTALANT